MFGDELSSNELLAAIERRFQFTLIISIFLSDAWDKVQKVINDSLPHVISDKYSYGVALAYIFLGYIAMEIFRPTLKKWQLEVQAYLLLVLPFALVIVIGFFLMYRDSLSGWYLLLFNAAAISIPFLTFAVVFVSFISFVIFVYNFFARIFKKIKWPTGS